MDPNNQNQATKSGQPGADELLPSLFAMHLGEPSSSRRQQPPLSPTIPTPPPDRQLMMRQLEAAWQQQWQRQWSYPGESSLTPSFLSYCIDNVMASSAFPPARQPLMASSSTNRHQRNACPPAASSSFRQAPPLHLTASSSTSEHQHNAYSAAPNERLLPNDYDLFSGLSSSWPSQAPSPVEPSLEQVQSKLLHMEMDISLAMSPVTSEHMVRLLQEGDERVRCNVLRGVQRAVHKVIENQYGYAVFVALLRACEGRFQELNCIVFSAAPLNGRCFLLKAAKLEFGEKALKELITAVRDCSNMSNHLINCLLREGLMVHSKGEKLLLHCFATLPDAVSLRIIEFAFYNMELLLKSSVGSRCVSECFMRSQNYYFFGFKDLILLKTSEFSKGQYSNYFIQRAIEIGDESFAMQIAKRVMQDVMDLSKDQFGSYVIETCFHNNRPFSVRNLVVYTFMALRDHEFAELVQNEYANYIIQKLVETAKDDFSPEVSELVRRIEQLPPAVLNEMHAKQVMRTIKKLFPPHRRLN